MSYNVGDKVRIVSSPSLELIFSEYGAERLLGTEAQIVWIDEEGSFGDDLSTTRYMVRGDDPLYEENGALGLQVSELELAA